MTNILYSYHNPGFAVRDAVITTTISVGAAARIINKNAGWLITLNDSVNSEGWNPVAWIPVHCISRVWDDSAGETVKIVDFVAGGDGK